MLTGNGLPFLRQRLQKSGFLGKLLTVGMLLVILTFSLFVFAFIIAGGAMAWAYLWWKTRAVRKQMRERPAGGQIIEGDVISSFTEQPTAQTARSAPVTIEPMSKKQNGNSKG